MAKKIQIRRDTANNWTNTNPVLSQWEQGFETDTNKLKIWDWQTAWNDLSYFWWSWWWDMYKSTYDTDNDWIVDNSKQVDGKDVSTTLWTDDTTVPTSKAVNDALSWYLDKSTYDTDDDWVVDNSKKLDWNSSSYYLDRANHTWTQDISTINNLQSDLDSKANLSWWNTFDWEQTISNWNIDFAKQTFSSSNWNATIDWTKWNKAEITLTENTTLSFTNPGHTCNLLLMIKQDSTGWYTVTWPSNVKWPWWQAPTLTTDANAIDIVSFYFDWTDYYWTASTDFS